MKEDLMNNGLKVANEKKLPIDLVNYFLGNDDESTVKNLNTLEKVLKSYTQSVRESILKEGSYTPPAGDRAVQTGTITQAEWDKNKNNLTWFEKNKSKIYESKKQGLIK
jgi:hypothetical protein